MSQIGYDMDDDNDDFVSVNSHHTDISSKSHISAAKLGLGAGIKSKGGTFKSSSGDILKDDILTIEDDNQNLLLKRRKQNKENWSRDDDFPDIEQSKFTGHTNSNFSTNSADSFRFAHEYNFKSIPQPENTKPDGQETSRFSRIFDYTPSNYLRLEEEEYTPYIRYKEPANEYYIDKLEGKTLDDLVISKMKEDAGAEDLPKDASRRQFVEQFGW